MQPALIPAQAATITLSATSDPTWRAFELSTFVPADSGNALEALKQTYLDCLKNVKSKAETMRQTVVALLDLGVPWQQLGAWAKATVWPTGTRRNCSAKFCSIWASAAVSRGAGPKPPREAYLVERYVNDLYAEDSLKFLRAACEVAKARQEGDYRGTAEELAIESIEVQ